MKVAFLHGPPAAGKLTIARELATLTSWRLFHNHLTVNLALAVYDFGTPGFIALREQIWFAVFRRALADKLPGLLFTFSPENSVPQRFIDELFAELAANGGDVIPVELSTSAAEIERRMANESRHREGKLTDVALYRELRDAGVFSTPVIPGTRLRIDTTAVTPPDAARRIAVLLG
jgi:hypothetical protein